MGPHLGRGRSTARGHQKYMKACSPIKDGGAGPRNCGPQAIPGLAYPLPCVGRARRPRRSPKWRGRCAAAPRADGAAGEWLGRPRQVWQRMDQCCSSPRIGLSSVPTRGAQSPTRLLARVIAAGSRHEAAPARRATPRPQLAGQLPRLRPGARWRVPLGRPFRGRRRPPQNQGGRSPAQHGGSAARLARGRP
jgi:hypothetical protein